MAVAAGSALKSRARGLLLAYRRWHARRRLAFEYRKVARLAARARAAATDHHGQVLVATCYPAHEPSLWLELLIALRLLERGYQPVVLVCDGVLSACTIDTYGTVEPGRFAAHHRGRSCAGCYRAHAAHLGRIGITVVKLGDFLAPGEIAAARQTAGGIEPAAIGRYRVDGCQVGEHARAGAIRYFARSSIETEPHYETVLRKYFESALLTYTALGNLLDRLAIGRGVANHGIYVPQGVIGEVFRRRGLPMVNWIQAYRRQCFIFSHDDTYHKTLISEPVDVWRNMPWNDQRRRIVAGYLADRRQAKDDWIWFNRQPDEDADGCLARHGIAPHRPIVLLLTNVVWDAQLHYRDNIYPDMIAWILDTVRHLADRPGVELVIRVHPAELSGNIPSRETVETALARAYPSLPANVHLVPPDDPVSTYALCDRADAALVYGTKMGVELAAIGKPVVVAGEAWIKHKGITIDPESIAQYHACLDALPGGLSMTDERRELALRYAYHFFMRRMMRLSSVTPTGANPPYLIAEDALETPDPALDRVIEGIISGASFIYDEYQVAAST